MVERSPLFQVVIPDDCESEVGVKPGDYGELIGYYVDNFAHT